MNCAWASMVSGRGQCHFGLRIRQAAAEPHVLSIRLREDCYCVEEHSCQRKNKK